jgi:hypothetical protein
LVDDGSGYRGPMTDSGAGPSPQPGDIDRIERALGWRPISCRPATTDRGTSDTAARWIVADGGGSGPDRRTAFVKVGANELTAGWTRTEYQTYQSLRGWFLPEVLGFDDDGSRPVLALEDLSEADWPPPWTDERVAQVLDALAAIAGTSPPDHLQSQLPDDGIDWRTVDADPGPFLALGLCSAPWLENVLPELITAAAAAPLAGDALVHLDIRSDNLCFRDRRAVVIDWNHACLANSDLDIAFWLPSLEAEGGPPPDDILPDAPGLAAWVAGYFCARAGEAPIPDAPHVRELQLRQSRTALPWAARALGLPAPQGPALRC